MRHSINKLHPMKNKLARIYKILNNKDVSAGFTLVELLVGALLTTTVVSLTGFGVVSMIQTNKTAKGATERRVELNRALDFISDEIKQARVIATNASTDASTGAPGFSSSGKTPVLSLQIPGVDQRVIYYIASKETGSPWLGPKVVYRWGPSFTSSGGYSEPTNLDSWTDEPLADVIVDTAPSSTPSCPATDWSLNPPSGSITGFYTCVGPSRRIAEIHLRGKLTDAYGNPETPLEVSTKAFARPVDISTALGGAGGAGGVGGGGGSPTFTTSGGTVTITQPSNMSIQVLGGDITCGSPGPAIPTTTTINATPSGGPTTSQTISSGTQSLNLSNVATGSTVTLTGRALAGYCSSLAAGSSYNSVTNVGTQVLTLRNGDRPPLFAPHGTQRAIDSYLTEYINRDTGRIRLADNQVIFLFELGTTDRSTTAYDMQDLVVLATVAPA